MSDEQVSATSPVASPTRMQRFRDFWSAGPVRRVVSLLLLGLLCAALGFGVGWIIFLIFGTEETLRVLKTITLVGVVVAVWKVLADNWSGIWDFLTSGDRSHLARPLSQLAIAFTGAGLVAGTDPPGAPPPDSPPALVIASSVISGPDEVTRTVDTRRIMLPYFNKNIEDPKYGSVPDDELKKICDTNLTTLATPDAGGVASIQTLACGLRACSTAKRPVKVDVRGFASSSSFTCGGKASADRNLELAERRREAIIKLLDGELKDAANCTSKGPRGTLVYEPAADASRWNGNYELMQRSRDLTDVRDEGEKIDRMREILTRRVDVVVVDAGACGGSSSSVLASND